MALQINPDPGDSITIDDAGVRITIGYWFRDDDFNGGAKTYFEAQFPRDFSELSVADGSLEQALMTLATQVARRTGVHS